MAVPPILESLDTKIHFEEPTRGKKNDFIYKTVKIATAFVSTYASGKQPKQRFRLQFVIFPE